MPGCLALINSVCLSFVAEYVHTSNKKQEKMTFKRVMDFVKDKGDESLMEKYRKCQRMLEETLTKNMCLQNVSLVSPRKLIMRTKSSLFKNTRGCYNLID